MSRATDYLRNQHVNLRCMGDSLYRLVTAVEAVEREERNVGWDTLTALDLAIVDVRRWDDSCADVAQSVYNAAMRYTARAVPVLPPPDGLFLEDS